ncbi:hypothetical protein L1987_64897 [Smallanthus sonchifolius]|uniref:Uncharacterized protein n=1 Tax=Smallanthus sonchifolius TaxID=185202 RepID=A0ACB9BSV1_9ASTR|nr:hypothetical protein L1987_64897 [Smallanthus sonchifolius]
MVYLKSNRVGVRPHQHEVCEVMLKLLVKPVLISGSTGSFHEERNLFTGLNMLGIGSEYAMSNAFSTLWSIYLQRNIDQRREPMARESDDIYLPTDSVIKRATVCLYSAYCC